MNMIPHHLIYEASDEQHNMVEQYTRKTTTDMFGIQGIIWEGLKATNKNKKVVLLITIFSILPFILILFVLDFVFIIPLKELLISTEWKNDDNYKIVVSSVMSFFAAFLVVAIMDMLATAYSANTQSITDAQTRRDKLVFSVKIWRRVTWTWSVFVFFSIVCIGGGIYTIFMLAQTCRSVTILTISAFAAKILYLCLATVSMMAIVITSISEEFYGLSSILEAGKFVKENKFHGFSLMVLFMTPFTICLASIRFMLMGYEADELVWYVFAMFVGILLCPLILFIFEVFRVSYLEFLKSQGKCDDKNVDQELKDVIVQVNQTEIV